jgi:2-(1,2-epoxy-1,2-dihydrophenyl)acetyl-CoA isomerase
MNDEVLYQVDGPIATVTLNRPDHLNIMTTELLEGVLAALEQAADDDGVRVVMLTGAGRAFSAGGDVRAMAGGQAGGVAGGSSASAGAGTLRRAMRSSQLLRDMPKITIAAVNGACAGAGLALACACDLRYCADTAVFTTAFVSVGLSGDFGGTWTLPRIVGPAKARELYLLSERFGSEEARQIGLVTRSFPGDAFMTAVMEVAGKLASAPPVALVAVKANLNDSGWTSFSQHLDLEAERHIRCGLTDDAQEAARAFIEKRTPVFRGH